MNGELISVIVPVYNAEEYLDRCIQSILRQTHRNIEFFLIDDGSTDASGQICDKYAKRDKRIIAIHQQNSGAGEARNVGIRRAKGKYLVFIDADDYVAETYLELMYQTAETEQCGIVQCNFVQGTESAYSFSKAPCKKIVLDRRGVFYTRKTKILIWCKLFRRDLFDGIVYPSLSIHDDEFITYKLLYKSEKTVLLSAKLYYYYQTDNSIMRKTKYYYPDNFIDAYEERVDFFERANEPELVKISYKEKCIRLALFYLKCRADSNNKNDQRKLLRIYEQDYPYAIQASMNFKERSTLTVFHILARLTKRRWR